MTLERELTAMIDLWVEQSAPSAKLWQNGEVTAYLAQSPEARDIAGKVCYLASQKFSGADIFPRITVDPESGSKMLAINVAHSLDFREAQVLMTSLFDDLPAGANDGGPVVVSVFKKRR